MSHVRLLAIHAENFRGFGARQEINLDADVVLVTGGNGNGKTSLTDAITWVLTGRLEHLDLRLQGLPKSDDYVINRYALKRGERATVELHLGTPKGDYVLSRRGGRAKNTLTLADRDGGELVDPEHMVSRILGFETHAALVKALANWGVLRQDAMLQLLLDAPKELWERLGAMLGLGELVRFVTSAREHGNRSKAELRAAAAQLDQQHTELERRDAQLGQAQAIQGDAIERAAAEAALDAVVRADVGVLALQREELLDLNILRSVGEQLTRTIDGLLEVRALWASAEAADGARNEVLLRAAATPEPTDPPEAVLARLALELVLGDRCPVCKQHVDPHTLEDQLRRRLAALEVVDTPREVAKAADGHAAAAHTARERAQERLASLVAEAPDLRLAFAGVEGAVGSEHVARLVALRDGLRSVFRTLRPTGAPSDLRSLAAAAEAQRAVVAEARASHDTSTRRAAVAKAFEDAAREGAITVFRDATRLLAPVFGEVYGRLSPHPTFRHLDLETLGSFGSGRVVPWVADRERNVDGNPTLICSDGQLSVIALSMFLGMALTTEDGALPFVVLDDPMQSMDVLNVLGLADLCRRLRERRQVIITTHDRRFASILERKLTPRTDGQSLLHVHFGGWSAGGPDVIVTTVEREQVVRVLDDAA
jgi:energy-coupling factor transporter ATP-binding protein EcfA2